MACLSTGVGRVVLIGPCRRVSSMSRELAPSLRRVSLITLWHGGSSMFYAPQLLSCLSRVSDVCVCVHVCASGRLPSCQSSRTSRLLLLRLSGGCAYRLLRPSVGLTREGFPTLPWHPCAVTPLLRGGWQEGRMQSVIGAYRSLPGPEESERE